MTIEPKYLKQDRDCIERLLCGEVESMQAIYQRHFYNLLRFVKLRVREPEDAKDITSQVFVKVLDNLSAINNPDYFIAWIYQIARNQIIDFYRKNGAQYQQTVSIEELPVFDAMKNDTNPATNARLHSMIKRLKPEDQELVRLFYFVGLSYSQIAKITYRSESCVRKKLQKTLKQLGDLYARPV